MRNKIATYKKLLTGAELNVLKKLSTPSKIQDYLESIPFNHEENGETCMSVRRVLREKKAHCLEGAMFACLALGLQGRPMCFLSIKVTDDDYDHVIALYKEGGYWGAISKTNHTVLGFRDPVYKTTRELAMSYFHEYFLVKNGEKTMRGYSKPIYINRFGTSWVHEENELFTIATWVADSHHTPVSNNKKILTSLRRAGTIERQASAISRDST